MLSYHGVSPKRKKRYPFPYFRERIAFFINSTISDELNLFSQESQRCLSPHSLRELGHVVRTVIWHTHLLHPFNKQDEKYLKEYLLIINLSLSLMECGSTSAMNIWST